MFNDFIIKLDNCKLIIYCFNNHVNFYLGKLRVITIMVSTFFNW